MTQKPFSRVAVPHRRHELITAISNKHFRIRQARHSAPFEPRRQEMYLGIHGSFQMHCLCVLREGYSAALSSMAVGINERFHVRRPRQSTYHCSHTLSKPTRQFPVHGEGEE